MATIEKNEFKMTAQTSNLEIEPGKSLPVWTFNNTVPGPEIRVKHGDNVKVTLKNLLPEPVTIHWHGVPVPNPMDGIPGVTQNAVQPGQTFTYEFKTDVLGTYWYHSHQDSVNQIDLGLYGAFIVEAKNDTVTRDYTLLLDEWMSAGTTMNMQDMPSMDHSKMNMDASSSKNDPHSGHGSTASTGGSATLAGSAEAAHDMSMYDLLTINGKSGAAVGNLNVKEGEKVRLRLINAGNKSHTLHLHGHDWKVTATDGQPVNNPQPIKDSLPSIAPGERYN